MNITVLGSTGSIGVNTLDVVRQQSGKYQVFALVAGKNLDVLCSQILEFRPKVAVVADEATLNALRTRLRICRWRARAWPELAAGPQARVAGRNCSRRLVL